MNTIFLKNFMLLFYHLNLLFHTAGRGRPSFFAFFGLIHLAHNTNVAFRNSKQQFQVVILLTFQIFPYMFGLLYQQEIQSKTWYFSLCCVNILNILHMLRGFGFHWFCWSFNKRVFIEQLTPATYQTSIWASVAMMLVIQKKKKLNLFEWSKTLLASFGDINICLLWKKLKDLIFWNHS